MPEDIWGHNGETVGDQIVTVEDLQEGAARGTTILAVDTRARRKLDAPEAGAAFRTDDIAFFHAVVPTQILSLNAACGGLGAAALRLKQTRRLTSCDLEPISWEYVPTRFCYVYAR